MPHKSAEDRAAAKRKHYEIHKDEIKAKSKVWNRVRRIRVIELIRKHKDRSCLDCGLKFPTECMDFDHLHDKKFNLSNAVRLGLSYEIVEAEIQKCDIVCANCHRVRTRNRLTMKPSDDKQQQKDIARDMRKTPEVEKGLRQFLKLETGLGNSNVYRMRHEFTFAWSKEMQDTAAQLMATGYTFEEAYAWVRNLHEHHTDTVPPKEG